MTISVLQERQSSGSSAGVTSFSLAFSSAVTAGSAFHVIGQHDSSVTGTPAFSDSKSNTYGTGVLDAVTDTTGQARTMHQVANNVASGTTTVTLTFGATASFPALWIKEIG